MREREEILEALHEADTTERAADIAVDFVMHVLAEAVGVSAWTPSDGSETWDGDVAGTVYSILRAARVLDADTDETAMSRADKAEAERDAARAEVERLQNAIKTFFATPLPSGKYTMTSGVVPLSLAAVAALEAALATKEGGQ